MLAALDAAHASAAAGTAAPGPGSPAAAPTMQSAAAPAVQLQPAADLAPRRSQEAVQHTLSQLRSSAIGALSDKTGRAYLCATTHDLQTCYLHVSTLRAPLHPSVLAAQVIKVICEADYR